MEKFIRYKFKDRNEWLQNRKKGIGGSDSSIVLGLNRYKTNIQLYYEKIGSIVTKEVNNSFTQYGTDNEDRIRKMFEKDYEHAFEVTYNDNMILINNENEFMLASLDGELIVKKDIELPSLSHKLDKKVSLKKGMKGIYECKTRLYYTENSLLEWENGIPESYYCQALHYMNVTDYDFHITNVEFRKSDEDENKLYRTYIFMKENVIEDLKLELESCRKFWECIKTKIIPSLNIY